MPTPRAPVSGADSQPSPCSVLPRLERAGRAAHDQNRSARCGSSAGNSIRPKQGDCAMTTRYCAISRSGAPAGGHDLPEVLGVEELGNRGFRP